MGCISLRAKLKGTNKRAKNQIYGKISLNIWQFQGNCVLLHVNEKNRIIARFDAVDLRASLCPAGGGYRRQVYLDHEGALGGTRFRVRASTGGSGLRGAAPR